MVLSIGASEERSYRMGSGLLRTILFGRKKGGSMQAMDLTGQTFGYLTVIKRNGVDRRNRPKWLCRCQCGNETTVAQDSLRVGNTKSCGCFRRQVTGNRARKHGKSQTSTHRIWARMIQRCTNAKSSDYEFYGGRGIKVCDRWLKFENFLADMGERPPHLTIERIKNHLGYEPGNCRWATRLEQANNMRSNHVIATSQGDLTLSQIARIVGIAYSSVKRRIKRGRTGDELLLPPNPYRPFTTSCLADLGGRSRS